MEERMYQRFRNTVHLIAALYIIVLFFTPFGMHHHLTAFPVVIIDTIVSLLYILDLVLKQEKRNKAAMVIDVWSAMPFFLIVGPRPLALVLNVGKLIRGMRAINSLHVKHAGVEATTGLKIAATFLSIVLYFATVIVLIEGEVNSNLETFSGGLWWAVVTITTTGYGDVTPTTSLGRIAATLLMLMGIGISSAIGAVFVSYLLRPTEQKILKEEQKLEEEEEETTKTERKMLELLRSIDKRVAKLEKKK